MSTINNFAALKLQYQNFYLEMISVPKEVKEISETNKVSQRVSYSKHGTFSKHGSNNFKRQGSYPNRQNHFLFQGQGQRRKPPSKFKTHKGARVEHTK